METRRSARGKQSKTLKRSENDSQKSLRKASKLSTVQTKFATEKVSSTRPNTRSATKQMNMRRKKTKNENNTSLSQEPKPKPVALFSNFLKDAKSQGVNANVESSPPAFVFGNVKAPNLLSAALINQNEKSKMAGSSETVNVSPAFQNNPLIGVFPIVIQGNNGQLLTGLNSSTNNAIFVPVSGFSSANLKQGADAQSSQMDDAAKLVTINSANENTAKFSESLLFNCSNTDSTDSFPIVVNSANSNHNRPSLASSDTVILSSSEMPGTSISPALVSKPNAMSLSSQKTVSLLELDSRFSLLPNISERTVSLQSIPTQSLFKPNEGEEMKDSASDITNNAGNSSSSVVLENGTVLLKLIQEFIKDAGENAELHLNKQTSTNSLNMQIVKSDEKGNTQSCTLAGSGIETPVLQTVDSRTSEAEASFTFVSSDSDKSSLGRSDTIILPTDISTSKNNNLVDLSSSNTLLLPSFSTVRKEGHELQNKISLSNILQQDPLPLQTKSLSGNSSQDALSSFFTQHPGDESPAAADRTTLQKPAMQTRTTSLFSSLMSMNLDQLMSFSLTSAPTLNTGNTQLGLNLTALSNQASLPLSSTSAVKGTQTDLCFGNSPVLIQTLPAPIGVCTVSEGQANPTSFNPGAVNTVIFTNEQKAVNFQQPLLQNVNHVKTGSSKANFSVIPESSSSTSTSKEIPTSSGQDDASQSLSQQTQLSFPCSQCEEVFMTRQEMKQHEKKHKKIFQCDLCSSMFTLMGNYMRHRKIHNLEPQSNSLFKCEECGRDFLQRCDLKRHQLIHSKKEPHRCEECGRGYIRKSDLVVHMRFHSREKAFKCDICGRSFFQSGDLGRHIRRTHQPNSLLTCGHCDRKYACENTLLRHMKLVHKDLILSTVSRRMENSQKEITNMETNDGTST